LNSDSLLPKPLSRYARRQIESVFDTLPDPDAFVAMAAAGS
jgi:hypothetical protein